MLQKALAHAPQRPVNVDTPLRFMSWQEPAPGEKTHNGAIKGASALNHLALAQTPIPSNMAIAKWRTKNWPQ